MIAVLVVFMIYMVVLPTFLTRPRRRPDSHAGCPDACLSKRRRP